MTRAQNMFMSRSCHVYVTRLSHECQVNTNRPKDISCCFYHFEDHSSVKFKLETYLHMSTSGQAIDVWFAGTLS